MVLNKPAGFNARHLGVAYYVPRSLESDGGTGMNKAESLPLSLQSGTFGLLSLILLLLLTNIYLNTHNVLQVLEIYNIHVKVQGIFLYPI